MSDKINKLGRDKGLSFLLYLLANALVLSKYTLRTAGFWWVVVLIYLVFMTVAVLWLQPKLLANKSRHLDALSLSMSCLMIVAMVILQYQFDPLEIRVDRWSGIHNSLDALFNGQFPYLYKTHLGHNLDIFPLWLVLNIPFYLLGNADLGFFIALAVFLCSIRKIQGPQALFCGVLLVSASVEIWYEVTVYSDYITNFLLVAAVVNFTLPYYSVKWVRQHWFAVAVVVGLFTSTRLSAFVPLAIMIFPIWLKLDWKKMVLTLVVFAMTFLLTFLPFYLWNAEATIIPLLTEFGQGSSYGLLILVPAGLLLSLMWRGNPERLLSYQALIIFLLAAVTFVFKMVRENSWNLFGDSYDLVYIGSLIPFAILALTIPKNT